MFDLSHEHELIVSTTQRFLENEIYPHEAEVEKLGLVPRDRQRTIRDKVLDMGFYAPNFPTELGGGGLDPFAFTLLERELGRGSMALTHFWGRPQTILMACEGSQKERFLYPAVRGEKMDALAMTEPEAGSDLRAMRTRARPLDPSRPETTKWELNGLKHFISGAEYADFVICFVVSGPPPGESSGELSGKRPPPPALTAFLVERGTPGFTIDKGYESVSHRGYSNSILRFENCVLPPDCVLGVPHRGWALMDSWLYATRLTVAAMAVGRARRAFDMAANWAATREQFGQKIGRFQGVGFQLADAVTEIDAADLLTLKAAWDLKQGRPSQRAIASAKLFATEMLARVTDMALQIHGGMGLMKDLPLERFWRDARVERIWDGTSEIQRHIIAREILRANR